MQRVDIWWATFRPPIGSEPDYRRPVLILQSDDFNKSRINSVVVALITSNIRRPIQRPYVNVNPQIVSLLNQRWRHSVSITVRMRVIAGPTLATDGLYCIYQKYDNLTPIFPIHTPCEKGS